MRHVGHALKSLALARSVTDLRDLEAGGYDSRGHPGYAVRRLTDSQVAYYWAARQLHDLAQRVRVTVQHGSADREHLATTLEELGKMDVRSVQAWFVSRAQARQWQWTVASLSRELRDYTTG